MQTTFMNPYENLFPIEDPAAFYGRHEVLERLLRRLFRANPPRSLQVVGLTRSGKSSLLNVIASLKNDTYSAYFTQQFGLAREQLDKVLVVQVNCAGLSMDDPSLFWNLMDRQLMHALKIQANESATEEPGCATLECFAEKLLAIKQRFQLFFLFDGFDRVLRQAHIDVWHNLRFLLEEGRGCIAYITATPRTLYDYYKDRPDTKDTAPLFSYFDPEPLYLGLLEPEGVMNFIKEPSARYGVTFTDEDMTFVYNKGGQHPDLTRVLCQYLFENYQLPPKDRATYTALYDRLIRYFEPFYDILKQELLPTQFDALLRVAMRTNVREIPARVQGELIKLGLLAHSSKDNQPYVYSEVLDHFLDEEELVGAQPARGSLQRVAPLGEQEEMSTLKIWERRRAVQVGERLERLSPNEWKLFVYLWNRANQTCTREDLIGALSSEDANFTGAALDITISRLRQKIEYEPEKPRFIVTVRGRGYRFEERGTVTVVR
jgi:DNA-binding response OmpR family regulator